MEGSRRSICWPVMGVPTIALYATPTSTVCSTAYPCSHPADNLELAGRPCSSSPPPSQRPVVGGLSCLFASTSFKHSCSSPGDELGSSLWYERNEELSSSFSYSPYLSLKGREQSPVSVFQGPVSCSAGASARSPPAGKYSREIQMAAASLRSGRDGLFNGFVRNALGSCLDYDLPPLRLPGGSLGRDDESSSSFLVDELTFAMDDPSESDCESSATGLLAGAQSRHKIFYEELVVKAFHEAEKAHRGQVKKRDLLDLNSVLVVCSWLGFWVRR